MNLGPELSCEKIMREAILIILKKKKKVYSLFTEVMREDYSVGNGFPASPTCVSLPCATYQSPSLNL